MKKLLAGLSALLLILFACSPGVGAAPPPGDAVTAFLSYVQAGEYAEAQALILGESSLALYDIEEEYKGIFQKLSYENISETINGNQAHVQLTINAVDFAATMEEIMAEAFYWVFTDITVNELTDKVEVMFIEKMTDDTAPMLRSEVTVTLELHEGKWRIIADDDFADAVTGGLISFAEYAGQWLS